MTTLNTKLPLNTGAEIPAQEKDAQEDAVTEALKAGYRHIDTARIYGTEPAVGRSEIFITTKLWNNSHRPDDDDVAPALDASLKDLDADYLDLYLMHWPSPFARGDSMMPKKDGKFQVCDTDYIDTWKAMEATLKSGKTKAIDISNFSKVELERLLSNCEVVPAPHQIECHPIIPPFGNQNEIYDFGKDVGKLMDDRTIVEIGKKYGKIGAQVALARGDLEWT
ncbi:hypothetical protein OEA41_007646 [Lepraria neglecta]|uniref:NADP-dependent oxidoreductase domain-containing protein n=1 Tax=Lepraria neglecta TaxID=209136 RepID=A0AAE0DN49_9LECA|nr:hypothetical protein OEA41_007646 [Lepraria neglecta]